MTIVLICLLIALMLPYFAKVPVAKAMHKLGGYDNHHPRAQQAKLTGFGARALAAHQNAFESLLIFAVVILTVIATDNINGTVEVLAVVHVIARMSYHILYLKDIASLRSLVWFVGIACSLGIFLQVL